jgi:hypothetical protein
MGCRFGPDRVRLPSLQLLIRKRDLSEVSRQEEDVSLRPIRFGRLRKDSLERNRSPVYVDCFNAGRKNEESRPIEE